MTQKYPCYIPKTNYFIENKGLSWSNNFTFKIVSITSDKVFTDDMYFSQGVLRVIFLLTHFNIIDQNKHDQSR